MHIIINAEFCSDSFLGRLSPLKLTSFTHHRGNKLGDDGAPLPHLTLLAVGEVWEDASDAFGAGRPARVHHDQHLHYGGVHISERWETGGKKTKCEMKNMRKQKRGSWGKPCWKFQCHACCVLLGHCLDDKDIFASHWLLDLYPCFYGNKQKVEKRRWAAQEPMRASHKHAHAHSYLQGLSVSFKCLCSSTTTTDPHTHTHSIEFQKCGSHSKEIRSHNVSWSRAKCLADTEGNSAVISLNMFGSKQPICPMDFICKRATTISPVPRKRMRYALSHTKKKKKCFLSCSDIMWRSGLQAATVWEASYVLIFYWCSLTGGTAAPRLPTLTRSPDIAKTATAMRHLLEKTRTSHTFIYC